jgi:hypothetical protein
MKTHVAAVALLALIAACHRGGGATPTTPAVSGGEPAGPGDAARVQATTVSFQVKSTGGDAPSSAVTLWITDETGASRSYALGQVAAPCAAEAGGDMSALGTLRCALAGSGANFVVVARRGEFIVLRQATAAADEEPADYIEQVRIPYPAGARLEFAP